MLVSRILARLLLSVATLSLVSCADKPLRTDTIQTAEGAITIAKKACDISDGEDRRWHVSLNNGVWDARGYRPDHSLSCGWKGAKCRASDGFTEGCEVCTGG